MKLSAPVYVLKSQAKELKKSQNISLSVALDEIAKKEGYATWSLLISKHENDVPDKFGDVLEFLNPADLVLVAARPGQGKTTFAAGLVSQAAKSGRPISYLFTVLERESESEQRIAVYLGSEQESNNICKVGSSDDISADHIVEAIGDKVAPGTLIVVDYLQLMDEKRINPPIQEQIERLKAFAKEHCCIFVFIGQIDPQVDGRDDRMPGLEDVRLPNPLDLNMFNKIIFMSRVRDATDRVQVKFAGKVNHTFDVGVDRKRKCIVDLA